MPEKYMTVKQVSNLLNRHPKTLYKQLRENTIALNYTQLSARRKGFRPEDVQRYLNDREVIRDGSGRKKPRKASTKPAEFRFMTDEEAQKFFANVKHDADGNVISQPGGNDD